MIAKSLAKKSAIVIVNHNEHGLYFEFQSIAKDCSSIGFPYFSSAMIRNYDQCSAAWKRKRIFIFYSSICST